MAITERQQQTERTHNVIMENRARLRISGVEDVESFDELEIVIYTTQGNLTVRGEGLHIDKLSIESGEVNIEGTVSSLVYEEPKQQGGLWARMFK